MESAWTLSRKEDESILYDKYSTEKEPQKRENELDEGEINKETEMDEIWEGNEVGEVEIDERVKEKKEQGAISERKSSQDIFSDMTVTSLGRKLEKQHGIDHRRENIWQGKKDAHPQRVKIVTVR